MPLAEHGQFITIVWQLCKGSCAGVVVVAVVIVAVVVVFIIVVN